MHAALSRNNARNAAGTDGISGHLLSACAGQLTEDLNDIFNLSLAQAAVTICFNSTFIVLVPKYSSAASLNDSHPVAFSPTIMKCFERLVLAHLNFLTPTVDPFLFTYCQNRCKEETISNSNAYVRIPFYSVQCSTLIPTKLILSLTLTPPPVNGHWTFQPTDPTIL